MMQNLSVKKKLDRLLDRPIPVSLIQKEMSKKSPDYSLKSDLVKEVKTFKAEPLPLGQFSDENMPEQKKKKKKKKNHKKTQSETSYLFDEIEAKRKQINEHQLKILERLDLDRPILIREKFDVLWNFDKANEREMIQQEIERRKITRCKKNKLMA